MLSPSVQTMDAIRAMITEDYVSLYAKRSFRVVGLIWGLTAGTTWRIVRDKNYWPKSKRIRKIIIEKARARGIEIVGRKRVRVELDPGTDKEVLRKIRALSIRERTATLVQSIKGE